jgi:three-Cys-motif partner protein
MAKKKKFALRAFPDPLPNLVVERGPDDRGVGQWVPNIKHTLMAKYISAAYGAMNRWPERVFIDPFCGPGRIQVEGESTTRDGGSVVAWRQSQQSGAPYTRVLVGDINPERVAACRDRLAALNAPVEAFPGPADETVKGMVARVAQRRSLCFAYLDPYNLALLSFDMIRTLATLPNIDFAVHFSTMDLKRNVDAQLDPERARFDAVAPGWRTAIGSVSKASLPVAFFNYWIEQVRGLGFTCSREMPLVTNNSQHEIYRLVFFARHEFPNRLWNDVARSGNLELF